MNNMNNQLYNPMINRGFNIINNTNNINNTNTQNLENEINNITNSMQLSMNLNVDTGLGSENLDRYSINLPISESTDCVICMNTFEKGNMFNLMSCMHSFCNTCSRRWFDFKSTCPLCKTNLKNE